MCLLALAYETSGRHALIVAANRDERHARPSSAAGWWRDGPDLLGGRDEIAGGTWLAVDRRGRLAAVTNRAAGAEPAAPKSRGLLVTDYLSGTRTAGAFARALAPEQEGYGPFNLLLFDGSNVWFASNRESHRRLEPGVHAIGNTALASDWPKLDKARAGMSAALALDDPSAALLDLLGERSADETHGFPHRQRAVFLAHPEFGTRSSTVILLERGGRAVFIERRFGADSRPSGEDRFEFTAAAAPAPRSRSA